MRLNIPLLFLWITTAWAQPHSLPVKAKKTGEMPPKELTLPASQETSSTSELEQLAAAAATAYDAGEFSEAVVLYLKAHKIAPAALLIYNIALIYDKKIKEPELAIRFYRRYTTNPNADPELVGKATTRIKILKKEQLHAEANPKGSKKERVEESQLMPTLLAGSGVLLLGSATVLGLIAKGHSDDFSSSQNLDIKKDHRDIGEAQALGADLLMGLGITALISGGLWYLLDDKPPIKLEAGPVSASLSFEARF